MRIISRLLKAADFASLKQSKTIFHNKMVKTKTQQGNPIISKILHLQMPTSDLGERFPTAEMLTSTPRSEDSKEEAQTASPEMSTDSLRLMEKIEARIRSELGLNQRTIDESVKAPQVSQQLESQLCFDPAHSQPPPEVAQALQRCQMLQSQLRPLVQPFFRDMATYWPPVPSVNVMVGDHLQSLLETEHGDATASSSSTEEEMETRVHFKRAKGKRVKKARRNCEEFKKRRRDGHGFGNGGCGAGFLH